jgi:peptidoglycan L-alanyl-D-glutamate endopeptidase CwlK
MFKLSKRSQERLAGVHPTLAACVHHAIKVTEVDFCVLEGLRSRERQAELVAAGASWTLDGRHCTGHAVDLGAWVAGSVRWDWSLYYKIAAAMRAASAAHSVPIRWGGCWDRRLASCTHTEHAVRDYVARCKTQRRKARIDGPHFELPKELYP